MIHIIDVENIEEPGDYKQESWAMDFDEKLAAVPKLKEQGNQHYREKKYASAAASYSEALGLLEQLMLRYNMYFLHNAYTSYKV